MITFRTFLMYYCLCLILFLILYIQNKILLFCFSLYSEQRDFLGNLRIVDSFRNPEVLNENDNFEKLSRGLLTQTIFAADENVDPDVGI